MPLRASLILLFAVILIPLPGVSQDNLTSFRDSLARIEDANALRRLESAGGPKRNANDLVREGFVALRQFELTAKPADSKRAQKAFEQAIALNPELAWAHYGLGSSLAGSPEARPLSAGGSRGTFVLDDVARKLSGNDPRSRARRAFTLAIEKSLPVQSAAIELGELAIVTRKRDALEEARLRLSDAERPATGATLVAWSRVEAALGNLDAAAALAERALAADEDSALALHALGTATLRMAGLEPAGAAAWLRGAAAARGLALDRYFDDLAPIATAAEKTRWSKSSDDVRRALLADFWDYRAGIGGVSATERAAEHYRRLAIAESRYRRNREFGIPVGNAMLSRMAQQWTRFDDRGDIYLRHGAPAEVLRTVRESRADDESWVYPLPDGNPRLFHFMRDEGASDFSLIDHIPCDGEYISVRAQYLPRWNLLGLRCDPLNGLSLSAELRYEARRGLETDSDHPNFVRELPFLYDLYTFRGTEGRTAVVAAFAVKGNAVGRITDRNAVRYRLDLSLILADTAKQTVKRTDDSATIRMPRALQDDELLRAHLEVEVPPSSTMLQRVIVTDPSEPGVGRLYGGPFVIPDYSGSKLMLSDIAFAEPDTAGNWHRGAISLALVPTNDFQATTFNVFYEVYNLPNETPFSTDITVEPVRGGAGAALRRFFSTGPIKIHFEGTSTAGPDHVLQELRKVNLPLRKGRYRFTILVKNMTNGETTQRQREFTIPG